MSDESPFEVVLIGGLGNQLFQFALGESLRAIHGAPVRYSTRAYPDRSGRRLAIPPGLLRPDDLVSTPYPAGPIRRARSFAVPWGLLPLAATSRLVPSIVRDLGHAVLRRHARVHVEADLDYDGTVLESTPPVTVIGFWHSPDYFRPVHEHLRASILSALPRWTPPTGGAPAIAVHVRLGDHGRGAASLVHHAQGPRYLRAAMDHMDERVPDGRFVLFSDEPEAARRMLGRHDVLDGESGVDHDPWALLGRIAACDHHIISNSSLSWWGAWLRNGDGREEHGGSGGHVVAPSRWFRRRSIDATRRYPASWHVI